MLMCISIGRDIFPVNFRMQYSGSYEMLKCISTAQARTKCVSVFWAQSGPRHFSCKFPYKAALLMSLVTC